jgi:ABC-type dipeptide/oligopeptide/nickel transport system permease component
MAASGNPVQVLAFQPDMTPAEFKRIGDDLGVNDPLPVQYLRWLA